MTKEDFIKLAKSEYKKAVATINKTNHLQYKENEVNEIRKLAFNFAIYRIKLKTPPVDLEKYKSDKEVRMSVAKIDETFLKYFDNL